MPKKPHCGSALTLLAVSFALLAMARAQPAFAWPLEHGCTAVYNDHGRQARRDFIDPATYVLYGIISAGIAPLVLMPYDVHGRVGDAEAREMIELIKDAYRGYGPTLEKLYAKIHPQVPELGARQLARLIYLADQVGYLCVPKYFVFNDLVRLLRRRELQLNVWGMLPTWRALNAVPADAAGGACP